jgi:hypothetical protein
LAEGYSSYKTETNWTCLIVKADPIVSNSLEENYMKFSSFRIKALISSSIPNMNRKFCFYKWISQQKNLEGKSTKTEEKLNHINQRNNMKTTVIFLILYILYQTAWKKIT